MDSKEPSKVLKASNDKGNISLYLIRKYFAKASVVYSSPGPLRRYSGAIGYLQYRYNHSFIIKRIVFVYKFSSYLVTKIILCQKKQSRNAEG